MSTGLLYEARRDLLCIPVWIDSRIAIQGQLKQTSLIQNEHTLKYFLETKIVKIVTGKFCDNKSTPP